MNIEPGQSKDDVERRALARIGLLGEVSAWLTAPLELDATLERVTRVAVPSLADGCVVQLLGRGVASAPEHEAPQFAQLVVAHLDGAAAKRVQMLTPSWAAALHRSFGALEVLRTGQPQYIPDLSREPEDESEPSLMRELSASSYVALPLQARGQLIGVLSLVHSAPTEPEPELDPDLLSELAQRASGVIDKACLYQEARHAIEVRDDLLAVVSHDLQSPLNAIALTVKSLLQDPQLSAIASVKRALALIERTTKHIGQLCTELMEVGSIQTGRLSVFARPTPLTPLLHEALAILEPLLLDKQQRVITHLEPELPPVQCDGERIIRVLMNLIDNAIKFTAPGGELVIGTRRVGDQAEVTVRDTGTGIAREDLSKLFEPYWRTRQSGGHGVGLGLYIARGIIEAHGGQIWVESELGVGSTFVFRLAFAPAEAT